jgi:hypothetical protein
MLRVILGLLKGGIIGAAIGYAALKLGVSDGSPAYLTYAAIGFAVGLICGKAIWRQETLWTPALKGILGAAICVGLYWVSSKFLGGLKLPINAQLGVDPERSVVQIPLLLGPALGILYGIFVEVDDGERKAPAAAPPPAKPA